MSASTQPFTRIAANGAQAPLSRALPEEVPVAIECNGIGYAVLMASPSDLIDLAFGFTMSERLVDRAADILDHHSHETAHGHIVRLTIAAHCAERLLDRVRHRASDSSCGLCGIESLEQAIRPLPPVAARWTGSDASIFTALHALDHAQPLNALTHAVHAAAACTPAGALRLVREDVGRHNALDKLIGAMARDGLAWDGGFALVTSRCSYELVEKAALANCPLLATISAPTALAIERAAAAGLELRTLVRTDAMLAPAKSHRAAA